VAQPAEFVPALCSHLNIKLAFRDAFGGAGEFANRTRQAADERDPKQRRQQHRAKSGKKPRPHIHKQAAAAQRRRSGQQRRLQAAALFPVGHR